jgi:hypothetical protein
VAALRYGTARKDGRSTARFSPRISPPRTRSRTRSTGCRVSRRIPLPRTLCVRQELQTAMGRNGSTVKPATRRGGPTASAGGSDIPPSDAMGPECKQAKTRNRSLTPDEPTVQDCMLLSAVKAASEDEKSPFENPVLQQYQQVRELLGSGFQGWRRPTQRCSPPRRVAESPSRRVAESPSRRVAESPSRSVTCTRQFGDAPSLD